MTKYKDVFLINRLGGFLFLIDRILKHIAYNNPWDTHLFANGYIGWQYFANVGIAFSIPLPQIVLLLATPVLLFWIYKQTNTQSLLAKIAISLIILGATSNYIDRVFYSITIDYIRLFTSIFNIADIMVLSGIILLIKTSKYTA